MKLRTFGAFAMGLLAACGEQDAQLGTESSAVSGPTGSLITARQYLTLTALPDGRALVAGGQGTTAPLVPPGPLAKAELYNPASGTFSPAGDMSQAREWHTATLLANGRVLVAGGLGATGGNPVASAEWFDPRTGYFNATGSMLSGRELHAAVALSDGRVLVAGGITAGNTTVATAEIWDPAAGRWSAAAPMLWPRRLFTLTLLKDGRVLAVGGLSGSGVWAAPAEIYDPASNAWKYTGDQPSERSDHRAFRLVDGRVVVLGGLNRTGTLRSIQFYDPRTNHWGEVGSLHDPRSDYEGVLLPDGRILIAGGVGYTTFTSVEIFDPSQLTSVPLTSMARARANFGLALLQDGRVLAAGGVDEKTNLVWPAELLEVACAPTTCYGRAAQCGTISDGCGGTLQCGTCGSRFCSSDNQCVCATCAALGKNCGTVPDGCGNSLDCGACATGQVCTANLCTACVPTTCAAAGATCGFVADGCGGALSCGTCPAGQACSQNNACVCAPTTCAAAGATCGSIPDGCGGTISCGTCGAGFTCAAENVCVADPMAHYDSTRGAPLCLGPVSSCDSGTLLVGRAGLGPEPNAPNTVDGCPDGDGGWFHDSESLDRLRISTVSGEDFASGSSVRVEADVWAGDAGSDGLDLFLAPDAANPRWTWIASLVPGQWGPQTLSTTFSLPRGGATYALRGVFRWGEGADPCRSGGFDDHDDLLFPVRQLPDTTPPTVSFTAPSVPSVRGSLVWLQVDASDDLGVASVSYYDGSNLIGTVLEPPWTFYWDATAPALGGPHTLSAIARDAAGNTGSASRDLIIDNVKPTVALQSPAAGATLSGSTLLGAAASDDVEVVQVLFYDGANAIGIATAPPWTATWNTAKAPDGIHSLSARAYDGAGNFETSAAVAVTVDNCVRTTCAAQGATCGSVPDGCGGTLDCGTCGSGEVCSSNACVCVPTTCAAQGATCGPVPDGCGGALDCGACGAGHLCENSACVPAPTPLTVTRIGAGTGRVISAPAGIDCGPACTASFPYGTAVTLSAIPEPDSLFTGWSGGGCSGTGSCVVSVENAYQVTARFEMAPVILSVSPASGGTVVSSPPGIDCGATCAASFPYGSSVALTASPAPGYLFAGWFGACSGIDPVCVLQVPAAAAEPAFTPEARVRIDPPPVGGLVSTAGGEISCSGTARTPPERGTACDSTFVPGTPIELTATADPGYALVGWTGACAGAGSSCQLAPQSGQEAVLSPVFTPLVTLQVSVSGANGQVRAQFGSSVQTCSATCSFVYPLGAGVTLTAGPTSPAATFAGWSGACTGASASCSLTMDSPKSAGASFVPTRWSLAVSHTGAGSVTSSPAGISDTQPTASFPHGTTVTLTATPVRGSRFVSWGGDCTGAATTCTLLMDRAHAVTAQFDPNYLELSVRKNLDAGGTVVSSPSGISCGSVCDYAFLKGTAVKLTATAARGYVFTGWSGGGCSGTSTCKVTMSQQRLTTANFAAR